MNAAVLKEMLECHYWANRVMLDSLEPLAPEQFTREVASSFPSIQATVVHMLNSERFLLGNFRGERLPKLERDQLLTLAGIRAAWAETEQLWRQATANLDETTLTRDGSVTFGSGQSFRIKPWQIIHQLLVHGPYHRGQVITLLHHVGGKPFKTDALQYHIVRQAQ